MRVTKMCIVVVSLEVRFDWELLVNTTDNTHKIRMRMRRELIIAQETEENNTKERKRILRAS